MRVLVTGGAGFIGGHLAERLLNDGDSVRILDTSAALSFSPDVIRRGSIDVVVGDLRDDERVRQAVAGVDVIYHLAAQPSVPESILRPATTYDINVMGTLRLLSAARDAGCRRLVFASSCAVYGNVDGSPCREDQVPAPISPYASSKVAGEDLCQIFARVYGLETVVLRYFNVYGPRQRADSAYAAVMPTFAMRIAEGQAPLIFGDGEQSRDFIYVEDVVAATVAAARLPGISGSVLNVASGQSLSLNRILAVMSQILGRPINAERHRARPGDILHSQADVSNARRVLGFQASVPLETGLASLLESVRDLSLTVMRKG